MICRALPVIEAMACQSTLSTAADGTSTGRPSHWKFWLLSEAEMSHSSCWISCCLPLFRLNISIIEAALSAASAMHWALTRSCSMARHPGGSGFILGVHTESADCCEASLVTSCA